MTYFSMKCDSPSVVQHQSLNDIPIILVKLKEASGVFTQSWWRKLTLNGRSISEQRERVSFWGRWYLNHFCLLWQWTIGGLLAHLLLFIVSFIEINASIQLNHSISVCYAKLACSPRVGWTTCMRTFTYVHTMLCSSCCDTCSTCWYSDIPLGGVRDIVHVCHSLYLYTL